MKKMKAAIFISVAMVLTVALLLSACGGETTVTATSTATTTATATSTATTTATSTSTATATTTTTATATTTVTVAKPEGTFTWGAASLEAEGFVPWVTRASDYLTYGPVYDPIAIDTPNGEHLPCVAESWEWSNDYHDLTIYVREGIQFHNDWGEITAEDLAYVIDEMRSEDSTAGSKAFMEIIESVEIVDPYTLIIHQSESNVDYADMYALSPVYAPVLCKAYVESVGKEEANINPVGSGPYKLIQKKTGNYLKYEAVDDHWRVVPEFEYLIIIAVPEESTRVAMLKTGDIDACSISSFSIPDLPEEDVTVEIWPGGAYGHIIFGGLSRPQAKEYIEGYHNQDPWVDIRVREAMNIAIDRDAINQSLHYGTADPAGTGIPMPGIDDLEPYPYDPDRAMELLAEAAADGVFTPDANGGFHFTLVSAPTHPGTPMIAKEAEAVAGYWADIGITVDISPIDFPAYWPATITIETAGECYTHRIIWEGSNPYSSLQLVDMYAEWGYLFQCPEIEILTPLAQAAFAEKDLEKRTEMYKEIVKVIHDNYVDIPLMHVPYMIAKNKHTVGEWVPNSSSYYFNFEYIRHVEPLNTFRLFEIWD